MPLVAGNPQDNEIPGDPDLDLVTILEDNDPLVIGSAEGLLEEAGIPFYVLGEAVGVRLEAIGGFLHPWCRIQVGEDRVKEARLLLRELQGSNPTRPE